MDAFDLRVRKNAHDLWVANSPHMPSLEVVLPVRDASITDVIREAAAVMDAMDEVAKAGRQMEGEQS